MNQRPCMNPASIIWPERNPDPMITITSQGKKREEKPVIILNRDWRPAPAGGDDD